MQSALGAIGAMYDRGLTTKIGGASLTKRPRALQGLPLPISKRGGAVPSRKRPHTLHNNCADMRQACQKETKDALATPVMLDGH